MPRQRLQWEESADNIRKIRVMKFFTTYLGSMEETQQIIFIHDSCNQRLDIKATNGFENLSPREEPSKP